MRTILAASALAKGSGKELPVLIPMGLHFRTREYFRTDVWVEYGEPRQIEDSDVPQNLVDAGVTGSWSEPPADSVFKLRDKLREDLVPLSPNTGKSTGGCYCLAISKEGWKIMLQIHGGKR